MQIKIILHPIQKIWQNVKMGNLEISEMTHLCWSTILWKEEVTVRTRFWKVWVVLTEIIASNGNDEMYPS